MNKEESTPFDFELFQAGLMDIPEGMTNGEVIQSLFPKLELGEKVYNTRRYFLMGESIETFDFNTTDRWWNTPYGGKEEE